MPKGYQPACDLQAPGQPDSNLATFKAKRLEVFKAGPGPSYVAYVPIKMVQRSVNDSLVYGWNQWTRFPVSVVNGIATTPAPVPAPLWAEAAAAILDFERLAGRA